MAMQGPKNLTCRFDSGPPLPLPPNISFDLAVRGLSGLLQKDKDAERASPAATGPRGGNGYTLAPTLSRQVPGRSLVTPLPVLEVGGRPSKLARRGGMSRMVLPHRWKPWHWS